MAKLVKLIVLEIEIVWFKIIGGILNFIIYIFLLY